MRVGDSINALGSSRAIRKPARFETSPTSIPVSMVHKRLKSKVSSKTQKLRASAVAENQRNILQNNNQQQENVPPNEQRRQQNCSKPQENGASSRRNRRRFSGKENEREGSEVSAVIWTPINASNRSQDSESTQSGSQAGADGGESSDNPDDPVPFCQETADNRAIAMTVSSDDTSHVVSGGSPIRRGVSRGFLCAPFPVQSIQHHNADTDSSEDTDVPQANTMMAAGQRDEPNYDNEEQHGETAETPRGRPVLVNEPATNIAENPTLVHDLAGTIAAEVGGLVMNALDNLRNRLDGMAEEVAAIRNQAPPPPPDPPATNVVEEDMDGFVLDPIIQPQVLANARGARSIGARLLNIFRALLPVNDHVSRYALVPMEGRIEIHPDTTSSVLYYARKMNKYLPMVSDNLLMLDYVKRKLGRAIYEHTPDRVRSQAIRRLNRRRGIGNAARRRQRANRRGRAEEGRLRGVRVQQERERNAAAVLPERAHTPAFARGDEAEIDDPVVAFDPRRGPVPAPQRAPARRAAAGRFASDDDEVPGPVRAPAPAPPRAPARSTAAGRFADDDEVLRSSRAPVPASSAAHGSAALRVHYRSRVVNHPPPPRCIECRERVASGVCDPCGHVLYCGQCLVEQSRCAACRAVLYNTAPVPANIEVEQGEALLHVEPQAEEMIDVEPQAVEVIDVEPQVEEVIGLQPQADVAMDLDPEGGNVIVLPGVVGHLGVEAVEAAGIPNHQGIPLVGYEERTCCVCTEPAAMYLCPCLHSQFCGMCALRLEICPLCRVEVECFHPRPDV